VAFEVEVELVPERGANPASHIPIACRDRAWRSAEDVWLSLVDGSFLGFFDPIPIYVLSLMLTCPVGSPGPPGRLELDVWMATLALAALSSTNNASAKTPATDAKKGSEGASALLGICAQDGVFWEDEGGGAGGGPKNMVRAVSALLISADGWAVAVVDDDVLGLDSSSGHSFARNDVPSLSTHLQMPSARSLQTRQLKHGPGIILRTSSACSYRRMRRRGANGRWERRDLVKRGGDVGEGCGE